MILWVTILVHAPLSNAHKNYILQNLIGLPLSHFICYSKLIFKVIINHYIKIELATITELDEY